MAAGDVHTILKPVIRVAPLAVAGVATKLPSFAGITLGTSGAGTTPSGVTYGSEWEIVKRTGNGAQITMNAAMQDITADEVGVIGVVSAGTENVTIAFQTRTPSMSIIQYLGHMSKTSKTAVTGPPAFPAYDIYKQNVGSQPFMIAIEGTYGAGGLTGFGGRVLALGYNCIQTENTQLVARTTGADAIVSPAATARALPSVLTASNLPTTPGYALTDLDEKFNMFVIPNIT